MLRFAAGENLNNDIVRGRSDDQSMDGLTLSNLDRAEVAFDARKITNADLRMVLALEARAWINVFTFEKRASNAVIPRFLQFFAQFMKGFNHSAIEVTAQFAFAIGGKLRSCCLDSGFQRQSQP